MKTNLVFLVFFFLVCGLIIGKDNSVKNTPPIKREVVSFKDSNLYGHIYVDNNFDTICVMCSWTYLQYTFFYECDTSVKLFIY